MKNKKVTIAIISVVALLLLLIGVTYAYWVLTKMQTNPNLVSSACLDITLDNESAAINLGSQYPMSDEEGMKLTPYTFTVTNNCNTSIDYQIALESIGDASNAIVSTALKVALDNHAKIYSNHGEVVATISGAYESRSIGYGTLAARGSEGSSITHSLRIWIDEDAPISEANKTFQSKISITVGQEIDSPYVSGTLAYDILANHGGANAISEIDATLKELRRYRNQGFYIGANSRYFGTGCIYNKTSKKYELTGEIVQATLEECRNGTKTCGNYTSNATSGSSVIEIIHIYNSTTVLAYELRYIEPFFSNGVDPSLNKTEDDLGTSYYFRGGVANNYVQFGSYAADYKSYTISNSDVCWGESCVYPTLEVCQNMADYDYESYDEDGNEISCVETTSPDAGKDMYWRIVRINGDGTIRLVYDGTTKAKTGTAHGITIGKTAYNKDTEPGVYYNGSNISRFIDSWYDTTLKTNYSEYIADGIFCNDKEAEETYYNEEGETTKENADFTAYAYLSYNRIDEIKKPKLTCTRPEDRDTMNTKLGNGALKNPVGLLSVDEVMFAGGVTWNGQNYDYYLNGGSYFWTSTPGGSYDESTGSGTLWSVNDDGNVTAEELQLDHGVRPVINLRADVEFTGDGSFETPYVIKTN